MQKVTTLMLKRKIVNNLEEWYKDPLKKALLLIFLI